jgi:sn-glycerol 3-phosphate transport system substrate-binding protein
MRLLGAAPLAFTLIFGAANAQTELELFSPAPVQGKLANEMQRLIGKFDASHPAIHVTAVYTGSYDDTNLKTRAAIEAGKPPGAVIISAIFVREYASNDDAIPLDDIIAQGTETRGQTPALYMVRFWPALRLNAMGQRHVYGVPFQNSTPWLYYSVDAFRQAGLDPD